VYVHCSILPAKAIPKMTYTVSGGTLNPTHYVTNRHSQKAALPLCLTRTVS